MSHEQRQHPRVDVRLAAEIQTDQGSFTGATRNLSAGGAALECDRPLRDGDLLRLSLFLVVDGVEDERTPPLVVGARVMWTGEGDDGSHTAGVRFENISPQQTDWLARFLAATGG